MRDAYLEWFSTVRSVPITLDSYPLVCNSYMKLNQRLILRSLSPDSADKELLIVHPGTERLLPCSIACTAFAGVFISEVDATTLTRHFQVGEMVIRERVRYRVKSVEPNAYVLISAGRGRNSDITTTVPFDQALDVRAYTGNSTNTGSHGVGRSLVQASKYLQQIVGDTYRNQALVQPLSTLVVCPRETADHIMGAMTFEGKQGVYKFFDVFPSALARSTGEIDFYGGSVGKGDPTVVFTNRISLARELMYDDDDDRQSFHAVIIDGVSSPDAQPEIDDIRRLLRLREKGWMLILQPDDNVAPIAKLVTSDLAVIHWSPEVLLSTIDDLNQEPENPPAREIKDAIDRTIDGTLERHTVSSPPSFSRIGPCRAVLRRFARQRQRTRELEDFIICAYGLINLFEQASFTMEEYEHSIRRADRTLHSPREQIAKLWKLTDTPRLQTLENDTLMITLALEEIYRDLFTQNPKKMELLRLLGRAREEGLQCTVAVPRNSYIEPAHVECRRTDFLTLTNLSRQTAVEHLIITATPNFKRDGINPLASRTAAHKLLLEYDVEKEKNDFYEKAVAVAMAPIERAAALSSSKMLGLDLDQSSPPADQEVEDATDVEDFETEIAQLEIDSYTRDMITRESSSQTATLRVVRLAQFDTGEWAWLSQHYTAYVLEGGHLVEKSTLEVVPGDTLVFSSRGEEIADFVDDILQELIQRENAGLMAEHYNRSKRWKNVLRQHMEAKNRTFEDVSMDMRSLGHPRHAATISSWLREDSSIVGPRDSNAFLAIGLLTNDTDIADRARQYKESCDFIRSQRIKILNYVQNSIIRSASKGGPKQEALLSAAEASFLGDVDKYAKQLVIEQVLDCQKDLPGYLVNRPLGASRT